jgi:hypothetical protein
MLVLTRFASEPVECGDSVLRETATPESRIGIMAIGTGEIGVEP